MTETPRVSLLRVALLVLELLALLPVTLVFGPYGFLAWLLLILLTAVAS